MSNTQSTVFRSRLNAGSTEIPKQRLLKVNTTAENYCELADGNAVAVDGVSTEAIPGDATIARSAQVGGVAEVACGAAIAIGDYATSDSSGRAITGVLGTNSIWGRAVTAGSTAGDIIKLDLDFRS